MREVVERLRECFDLVIVDTGTAYDERTLTVLDVADDVLLVLTPEAAPVRNTLAFLEVCEYLGCRHKVRAVLNRASGNVGLSVQSLPQEIRDLLIGTVASDGRTVVGRGTRGQPFVLSHPDTKLAQDVVALAAQLARRYGFEAGRTDLDPMPGPFGLLRRRLRAASAA